MDELLSEVGSLCRHEFAHHVMESLVEHGIAAQRSQVLACLENEMGLNLHDRSALYTLGSALHHCSQPERARLAMAVQRQPNAWPLLMEHPSGSYILSVLGFH